MLNTVRPVEAPDEPLISIRQLTTTSADYLPSTHPITLLDKQPANRLGTFLANLKLITTDRWVLHAVSGYKIPFLSPPHHWRAGPKVFREGRPRELMKESIQSLISRGAISVVDPCPEQFISTLFLVEKGPGTGEFRPVINLKALNRFLPKEKFKMEGLHTTRSLLRRGDFMMKLDLKDAYYAVPIHPESRKYLRFYLLPCGMDRSVGSTFTLQSPATPAGSATPPVWMATQVSDKCVSTIPGGPGVVGVVESTLSQSSGHHPTPPPLGPYHHDRCIFAGLGSDLQWQDNRGTLECGGGRTTHQWPRARGGHPRLEVIPGRGHEVTTPDTGSLSSTAYPSGDGQYYGGYIREQGGGALNPLLCPCWPWDCGLSC